MTDLFENGDRPVRKLYTCPLYYFFRYIYRKMLLDASKYYADLAEKTKKPKTIRKKLESEFYIPPIPGSWIAKVFNLSFIALRVALILWRAYRMQNSRNPFKLTSKYMEPFGLSRNQKYRGLAALQKAGLIEKVQKPGQAPLITLMDFKITESSGKRD